MAVVKTGKNYFAMVIGAMSIVTLIGASAGAAFDDEDEAPAVKPATQLDHSKRRLYPGGRDEQDLKVQIALPNPSRVPDASSGGAAGDGEGQTQPAETD